MKVLGSKEELRQYCADFFDETKEKVLAPDRFRREGIDVLVWTSVFGPEDVALEAREFIYKTAFSLGIFPASIHELYMAMGRGEVGGFTVPAINIRCMTYDIATRVFTVARRLRAGAFIFEIAKSEMAYTGQSPSEYATSVLAGAVKANYNGPVFIQGDHFQVKRENFLKDHKGELDSLRALISSSIEAGFFNIDIDASTLVDYSRATLNGQQEDNFTVTALLTEYIRDIEPEGITVSVGAEIGHIGGKNSTVEEAIAFMEGYLEGLQKGPGISKLSVQTGTTHGGVPLPDGSVAKVKLDFSVLKEIGALVRQRYGLSGTVQHGASTLPEDLFGLFPDHNCSEIHLATGFQNIMYEEAPEDLRREIYEYLKEKHKDQWKEGMTEEQFIYKTRKLAFGPFKGRWWELAEQDKERILARLEEKFTRIFSALRVQDTEPLVKRYIKPVPFKVVLKEETFDHEVPEEGAD